MQIHVYIFRPAPCLVRMENDVDSLLPWTERLARNLRHKWAISIYVWFKTPVAAPRDPKLLSGEEATPGISPAGLQACLEYATTIIPHYSVRTVVQSLFFSLSFYGGLVFFFSKGRGTQPIELDSTPSVIQKAQKHQSHPFQLRDHHGSRKRPQARHRSSHHN